MNLNLLCYLPSRGLLRMKLLHKKEKFINKEKQKRDGKRKAGSARRKKSRGTRDPGPVGSALLPATKGQQYSYTNKETQQYLNITP